MRFITLWLLPLLFTPCTFADVPIVEGFRQREVRILEALKREVPENISQEDVKGLETSLRELRCFLKCTREPPTVEWDASRQRATPDVFNAATFDVERVLAKANASLVVPPFPNRCQFECLDEDNDHYLIPYISKLAVVLESLTGQHAHIFFTQAVLNHIGASDYTAILGSRFPSFRLPVCISPFVILDSQIEPWGDTGVPLICGDWKASDTRTFLSEMSLGPDSPDYKAGKLSEKLYEDSLLYNNYKLVQHRPLTHFLTLCETGYKYQPAFWDWNVFDSDFQAGPNEICPAVREDIKDMTELEANLWFCYGTTTAETFKKEKGLMWKSKKNKYLCDNLEKYPGYSQIPPEIIENAPQIGGPFYLEHETYMEYVGDYKNQLEVWKKAGALNPPFRWKPNNAAAIDHRSWPKHPPVLFGNDSVPFYTSPRWDTLDEYHKITESCPKCV